MTIPIFDAEEASVRFEARRLAILESLAVLDTAAEREYDTIVQLAQRLTGSKMALIAFTDRDRQWFKARIGLDVEQTPRELTFCTQVVEADASLVVPDATKDTRFAANPLVTGTSNIRFYAGVPIHAGNLEICAGSLPVGTLCVLDDHPRDISGADLEVLAGLAQLVEALVAARSSTATAVRLAEQGSRNLQVLDQRHRQLRQAERIANMGSWRLTLADNHTEWSEQTYAIHGLPLGTPQVLETALDFFPPRARAHVRSALERTIQTGEPFDVETDFTTAQGKHRRVRSMGELELAGGAPVALIGVFQDITERYKMEQALRQAAHTDDLTRIASRAHFAEVCDERIAAAAARPRSCALMLIDLDHFKAVNDNLGHHAGDEVLRVMASRLQAAYLSRCFAARLGGDEFVLVVDDPALMRDLPALIGRLLCDLRYSIGEPGRQVHVSATIGACWLGEGIATRSELLHAADDALYQAKRRGRGTGMIAGDASPIDPAIHQAPLGEPVLP
jgi:diguanylate cyclase (GGDEF)-like protein/PAS domain S-box-containing protein